MSANQISKQYQPKEVEERWLQAWAEGGYVEGDESKGGESYAVTLPPPNVTGALHMGHALGSTIQDMLVRWQRMSGKNTMWMPGTDHAGIATQMLVERDLKAKENKSRHDIGREKFLERTWKWKEEYGGKIQNQLKLMGFSLDWPRERFTMDEGVSKAVKEVFVKLYEDGLIYREHRLVNWCTDCFTAVSDLEVNNAEEPGHLWELLYPIVGSEQSIVVATTRPETMLGDTAVAVHPDDERYKDLIGKEVQLPLCDRTIPIVGDTFVDQEFGSGAVKITPGHDENDFQCGKRLGLDTLTIINKNGKIIDPAPQKYCGLSVEEARKAVVSDLEAKGHLGEIKDYKVPKGRCDRSKTIIEPLLSEQWWVKADVLAKPAIEAVENGTTKFVPELWTKTYMHWMKNIKDWCISRQLWWGHRIPAWHCTDCTKITVAKEEPSECKHCKSKNIAQDEDVLDTWFSSALWPFSTLGWPENTASLERYYPNQVLVTAPDIIFFWVARMMMMGIHFMKEVPFKTVYMTPIVTDENGDKMSKVKGNVIDPLSIVFGATKEELLESAKGNKSAEKFIKKNMAKGISAMGADALRFSLAALTMPGRNIRISMERVEGYRHFINKIWNASRFLLMNLEGEDFDAIGKGLLETKSMKRSLQDRWIMSRLQRTAKAVGEGLTTYRFSEAANTLYHFVWGDFCDWYIETSKKALKGEHGSDSKKAAQCTMVQVLSETLKLLHPIIPFATEEIWQALPKAPAAEPVLMCSTYPVFDESYLDTDAEGEMGMLMATIAGVRSLRSTYGVPPAKRVNIKVFCENTQKRGVFEGHIDMVETVGKVSMKLADGPVESKDCAKTVIGSDVELSINLSGLIDFEKESLRIKKDIGKTEKEISFIGKKLNNKKFLERAPKEVVAKEKEKLQSEQDRLGRLEEAQALLVKNS